MAKADCILQGFEELIISKGLVSICTVSTYLFEVNDTVGYEG